MKTLFVWVIVFFLIGCESTNKSTILEIENSYQSTVQFTRMFLEIKQYAFSERLAKDPYGFETFAENASHINKIMKEYYVSVDNALKKKMVTHDEMNDLSKKYSVLCDTLFLFIKQQSLCSSEFKKLDSKVFKVSKQFRKTSLLILKNDLLTKEVTCLDCLLTLYNSPCGFSVPHAISEQVDPGKSDYAFHVAIARDDISPYRKIEIRSVSFNGQFISIKQVIDSTYGKDTVSFRHLESGKYKVNGELILINKITGDFIGFPFEHSFTICN